MQPKTLTSAAPVVPWPVFFVSAVGAFVVALDVSIVNIAFPSIRRSFADASQADLSWVITAYSIVFGSLLLAGGRIADRSGRRRAFFAGLLVFAVGSFLTGIAPGVPAMIAGRCVQAAGAALLMPASLGVVLSAARPEARPVAVAMWGAVGALAIASGPALGGALIEMLTWRAVFFINVAVAFTTWLAGRRVLPETAAGGPLPDLAGVALVTATVAALALGITQGHEWGWDSPRIVGAFAAAGLLLPATLWRSARHPVPALDLRLFRSRPVALANGATLLFGAGFFAMLLSNVLFLTSVWGYSTVQAGLALTPGPLVVAALSSRVGRLVGRVGFRPVLMAGGLLFAGAALWFVLMVEREPAYLTRWLPGALMVGLGVVCTIPVLSAAAVSGLPADRFAVGSAANQTARQLGAVLGIALLVAILGEAAGPAEAIERFRHGWSMCAAAALLSALVSSVQPPLRAARPADAMLADASST